ncbi:phage recombination protein Bet [Streptomyces sp. NPDC003509]
MTEIVQAGGSLAIRPEQTVFSAEQAAVLRQSGIDNDVTNAELAAFLHLCQRTQLDPFSRQIYLIGRWDNRQKRKVFTPQTSIDGYRVIAHRVIAETKDTFGYEDTLWCDSSGRWRDVWLADEAPAAVKVTVLRNGQRFSAVALFREYMQTGKEGKLLGLWGKMPAGQIAKCGEALALRKAFPHDLAGVYTAEEMAQADNPPAAEDRHLRKVQPGEGDPWADPEQPYFTELVRQAEEAANADAVRAIWQQAKQANAPEHLLAKIVATGREKAAPAAEPTLEPAAADDGYHTGPAADDVVDAEVVSPEDDYANAVAELREAAELARLEDFEQGTEQALGMPLADAPVEAIRALAATIRPAA